MKIKKSLLLNYFIKTLLPALIISIVVLFVINPVSCKNFNDRLNFLDGDYEPPELQEVLVNSPDALCFKFSEKILVKDMRLFRFYDDYDGECTEESCNFETIWSEEDEKCIVTVVTENVMQTGMSYEAQGWVSDMAGNTLTFAVPFVGYNDRVPEVIISELRNAYGWASSKGVKRRKAEFVELYVLSDGNLSALELVSANDGSKTSYTFPNVEVKKGDYVIVHMRCLDSEDLLEDEEIATELGIQLDLSKTQDSNDGARDLWSNKTASCFSSSDIVILRNTSNGKILDCVEFAMSSMEKYPDDFDPWLNLIEQQKVWEGEPLCVDNLTATSLTRTISRQNIDEVVAKKEAGEKIVSSARDFAVVKSATPGVENSKEIIE